MSDFPSNEQECQQDILRRIHNWICMLEQRITLLSTAYNPEDMKPGECEQAISRYLTLMLRLFQLRQQYAKDDTASEHILEAVLRDDVSML